MEYEKLLEGNFDEFINDIKVAFFDVTARNQALMDQIEVALSHESDPDRINSLQTLWADYHDAVKGCVGGANMIATSVEQLRRCSSAFELLMSGKDLPPVKNKNEKDSVKEINEDAIRDAVVEVPEDVIIDEEEETTDLEEKTSSVKKDNLSDKTVNDEKESVIDKKEDNEESLKSDSIPDKMIVELPQEKITPAVIEPAISADNVVKAAEPTLATSVEKESAVASPISPANNVITEPATLKEPVASTVEVPSVSTPIVDTVPAIVEATPAPVPSIETPVVSTPTVTTPDVPTIVEAKPTIVEKSLVASTTSIPAMPVQESTAIASNTTTSPSIVEPPVIIATSTVEVPTIVSSSPVVETPVASTPVSTAPIAAVPEVSATPTMVASAPVAPVTSMPVITTPVAAVPEVAATPTMVASVPVAPVASEAPANSLSPVTVLQPIEEKPVEVPKVDATVTEAKVAEESVPNIVLPTIAEEKVPEAPAKEATTKEESNLISQPVIPLPQIEEPKEEEPDKKEIGTLDSTPVEETETSNDKDLLTFVKSTSLDTKAILVTKSQAQKLRYSKDLQSALVRSIHPVTTPVPTDSEEVTEEQLEDMMNQLSALYEQGKMDEAEKMSERIGVLSKKLNPAA